MLNSMLRFPVCFTKSCFNELWSHSNNESLILVLTRDRCFNGNILMSTIRKEDSMRTITFVGRQHISLINIMDDINCCCSFQVGCDSNFKSIRKIINYVMTSFLFQIVINIATTFICSVKIFYTFYRYFFECNNFFEGASWVYGKSNRYAK